MKKKLVVCIALVSLLLMVGVAVAANPIKIFINGKEVKSEVSPIIQNGRVLVPIRVISESLGVNIEWDGTNREVKITSNIIRTAKTADDVVADMEMSIRCLSEVNRYISDAFAESNRASAGVYREVAKGWLSTSKTWRDTANKGRNGLSLPANTAQDLENANRLLNEAINEYSLIIDDSERLALSRDVNGEHKNPKDFDEHQRLPIRTMDAKLKAEKLEKDVLAIIKSKI